MKQFEFMLKLILTRVLISNGLTERMVGSLEKIFIMMVAHGLGWYNAKSIIGYMIQLIQRGNRTTSMSSFEQILEISFRTTPVDGKFLVQNRKNP